MPKFKVEAFCYWLHTETYEIEAPSEAEAREIGIEKFKPVKNRDDAEEIDADAWVELV